MIYGESVVNHVIEGQVWCTNSGWTALQVGSSPLKGRKRLEFQVKGPTGLGIAYVSKSNPASGVPGTGTFTTPTGTTAGHVVIPANSIRQLPVGDEVTVYGRAHAKAGSTATGSKVVIVESR